MSLIADVQLTHSDQVLWETIRTVPEISLETEWHAVSYSENPYLVVSAYGDDFDRFDAAVVDDQTVREAELITEFSHRRIYRIEITSEARVHTPRIGELGIAIISVTSGNSGWIFRLQVPDRDTLTAFREYCTDEEISFQIHKLVDSKECMSGREIGVTEAQREALLTAYQEGYFEEPREASLQNVADELGISSTATSGRLRRGITTLIETTVLQRSE